MGHEPQNLSAQEILLAAILSAENMPENLPLIPAGNIEECDPVTGDFMSGLLLEAGIQPNEFRTALKRDPEGFRDWVMTNLSPLQ